MVPGMAREALSRSEAEKLSEQYQYLVGEQFSTNNDDKYVIDCVTIAPFDDINRYIFMLQYREGFSLADAISQYEGCLFDVVVLTRFVSEKTEIILRDLRSFLIERNIVYDREKQAENPA